MIELKNVTKKYGKHVAIDNISFKIEKGEIVGVFGRNGEGKNNYNKLNYRFAETYGWRDLR